MIENSTKENEIIFSEIQILLAEKRTSLSFLRTGIAVLALPLSIVSALIATSKYYDYASVLHLIIPVLVICSLLVCFGIFLIIRSLLRNNKYDKMILKLKQKSSFLKEILD